MALAQKSVTSVWAANKMTKAHSSTSKHRCQTTSQHHRDVPILHRVKSECLQLGFACICHHMIMKCACEGRKKQVESVA